MYIIKDNEISIIESFVKKMYLKPNKVNIQNCFENTNIKYNKVNIKLYKKII